MRRQELTAYQQSLLNSTYLKSQKAVILYLEDKLLSHTATKADVKFAIETLKADRTFIEYLLTE